MLCGVLSRPLSTEQPLKAIDIHFAILPAIKDVYPTEAIMGFAGGPGQSAIELAGQFNQLLRQAREKRDIILIDQRGTGRSHQLKCDGEDLITQYKFNDTEKPSSQLLLEETNKCKATIDTSLNGSKSIDGALLKSLR